MIAETIARALGGRKVGAAWIARCPAHKDRGPSLSIADGNHGKVLVHCHAGCDRRRVIAALKVRRLWNDALEGLRVFPRFSAFSDTPGSFRAFDNTELIGAVRPALSHSALRASEEHAPTGAS